eukprot:13776111-Alexandrium_andersonii.AAC.1
MSASLVGSEMCIRDRFSHAMYMEGAAKARHIILLSWPAFCKAQLPEHSVCLLYTSDAADDM